MYVCFLWGGGGGGGSEKLICLVQLAGNEKCNDPPPPEKENPLNKTYPGIHSLWLTGQASSAKTGPYVETGCGCLVFFPE